MKKNLDSSQLRDIQYDTNNQTMIIRFQDHTLKNGRIKVGKRYIYYHVPQEIYETIIEAKSNPKFEFSHGKCFHRLVKSHEDLYPYELLD
ncbi:KTSC domain-containing protein [Fusobacterium sp. DD17]|nr:KTSC domain-containing protein [Fusobacterium sp. DD17]